ncbi:MAG: polysaccharide deacetylase family protein, partial [Defluviitaleaceae bacterium]|nr:polysaccharide deacetylase family protein [Defluviitaleaceae bacterium]
MKKAIMAGLLCVVGALAAANADELCNKARSWFFVPTAHGADWEGGFELDAFDTHYLGDTESRAIYLTFDEGYELGYTAQILDVLREKDVPAAFFVTKPYIKEHPELV